MGDAINFPRMKTLFIILAIRIFIYQNIYLYDIVYKFLGNLELIHQSMIFTGCPVRVRKNIKNLEAIEIADLNQALKTIKANGKYYDQVATYHGEPYNCCPHDYRRIFRDELFLFWHSVYLEQMEDLLGEYLHNSTLGLPYWDWTEPWDSHTPLIQDIAKPDASNPWSSALRPDGANTTRNISSAQLLIDNIFEYKNSVTESLCKTDFLDFSKLIEFNPHNSIHIIISGDMGTVRNSSYDPIFYLHHNTIEKVFREYQLCQELHFASSWTEQSWIDGELRHMPLGKT